MQTLKEDIKISIFKFVDQPLNLVSTCRDWSNIAKNPSAKAEWLILSYGRAHALFHAVRLGPRFIDVELCEALLEKDVIISKCFIEKLLKHFGNYDKKLLNFKMEYNVIDQFDNQIGTLF